MYIQIIDDQDNWMQIKLDNNLWYEGHISSFNNVVLRDLLEEIMPAGTIIVHDDNPENFEE